MTEIQTMNQYCDDHLQVLRQHFPGRAQTGNCSDAHLLASRTTVSIT